VLASSCCSSPKLKPPSLADAFSVPIPHRIAHLCGRDLLHSKSSAEPRQATDTIELARSTIAHPRRRRDAWPIRPRCSSAPHRRAASSSRFCPRHGHRAPLRPPSSLQRRSPVCNLTKHLPVTLPSYSSGEHWNSKALCLPWATATTPNPLPSCSSG
jgi:hypothetical protein